MAWSLGLRLCLYGECRLDSDRSEPAEVELALERAHSRRFALRGLLRCAALGSQRAIGGVLIFPAALELELGNGWAFEGRLDQAAPRSLLGRSLWKGPLTQARELRGSLLLRLDLRHDWPSLLGSLRVQEHPG